MANDRYDTITYVNGDWIPWSQVKIEPDDIGFQLGETTPCPKYSVLATEGSTLSNLWVFFVARLVVLLC